MKFRTLVALVALAAFTGSVQAIHAAPIPQVIEAQDTDPRLVEQLIEAVAGQCDLTCCEVREAYAEGRMDVEKIEDGYRVQVVEKGGTGITVIILDEV